MGKEAVRSIRETSIKACKSFGQLPYRESEL
jgi:hypothetical protein